MYKLLIKIWVFSGLLCLFTGVMNAQTYRNFKQVPLNGGASMVASILQDRSGMIWLGTNKGLYSYDGYTVYAHNKGRNASTLIYCGLDIDGSRLYLGADNGLLVYNYRTDKYESLPCKFPSDIRAMARDGNCIWIGSLQGLFLYDMKKHILKKFDRKRYPNLPHQIIYSIIKASDHRIYVGTYNGLCYFDKNKRRFVRISLPVSKQKCNVFVNSLLEDKWQKCIWIGTEGNLFRYFPLTGKVDRIPGLGDNSMKALSLDDEHRLLVTTDNGLFVCKGNRIETHVLHDSRNSFSISNDVIWSILHDQNGNIWLGTDDGVSMEPCRQDLPFIPISQITGVGAGNHFYSILRDYQGTLWLGGSNGLISSKPSLNSPQTSRWFRVGNRRTPLTHNRIRQIYEDHDRHLWICTDGGLHRWINGQWHRYDLEDRTRSRNANWAYNMYEDKSGRLWVATCLGGVLVVNKKKLEASKSYCIADYSFDMSNGLAGMFVNQLAPDAKGHLWILLYNCGLQRINMRTMRVQNINLKKYTGAHNPSYILSDSQCHVWVGLRGGVLYLGDGDSKPEMLRFHNSSSCETVAMAEVNNEIWVTTDDGIWIVDKKSRKCRRLSSTSKIFSCLYYNHQLNSLYMGSIDGVVETTPERFLTRKPLHPIQLVAVSVNNKLLFSQKGEGLRFIHSLEFNADENHLVFEFSDLPYSQTEKNRFVYRLENVDDTWIPLPADNNKITFNNLPYGHYKLVISRLNVNGEPSNSLVVKFRILPPWYLSWWAKWIYAIVLIAFLVWFFNFFRMRNRLKLERKDKECIMEQSRQKLEFFTNISHDFKAPLSMIIAPVSRLLIKKNDGETKKQLELIQRSAMKLNQMIHQLIDFDRVENNINSTLMLGSVNFIELARKVYDNFKDGLFKEKGLKSEFQSNVEDCFMNVDVLKIESVLANVFSNSSKYTPSGGTVSTSIKVSAQNVEVKISDSGIGIPAKDLPYVSQRFFQSSKTKGNKEGTGIGLYVARAYTELHGGHFEISSEENKGTTVIFTIPVKCGTEQNEVRNDAEKDSDIKKDAREKPLVVVVDDNKDVVDFIVDTLTSDFHCLSAFDGKTGLEMCLKNDPALIITDVVMPVMSGMEMCQLLRKNVKTSVTPIIMLTAKDDKITEMESIRINIDAFLLKPFDANILLLRAKQLVETYRRKEAKERMKAIIQPKETDAVSDDEKFLLRITTLIEDRISDFNLNVNSLCEQLGLGNKLVYRKLKQLTGQSPVEYIKSIRMKKAAMLLGQKKFTVSEVMYMVGFSNSSYFSKCFQAEFNITPKQYMDKRKQTIVT